MFNSAKCDSFITHEFIQTAIHVSPTNEFPLHKQIIYHPHQNIV